MSSPSVAFQQRSRLSTSASVTSSPSLQVAAAAVTATTPRTMSRFGTASKLLVIGAATVALGAAAAAQMVGDDAARIAQAKAKAETDKRYQELLNAYGSGESLDDLQNAVANYGGSQPRG